MKTILEQLKTRKGTSNQFGYGLCTAEPYVRRCLNVPHANDAFRVSSPDDVLKHASEVLSYAAPEMVAEKKATSKFADLMPDGVEVPENTIMVIRHVLTTTKEDRDNDILETSGAELDPKAPLLWQHMHTMPIGKVLGEVKRTKSALSVVSAIVGGEKNTPLNDLAHDAATLVESDVLRFSHGFRALEWDMRETKDEDEYEWPGFHITKFEIMEASLVSVPSNADASVQEFATQKMKSDFFKSLQKSVNRKTRVQVNGSDVESKQDCGQEDTQLLLRLGDAEVTVTNYRREEVVETKTEPVNEAVEVEAVDVSPEVVETSTKEPEATVAVTEDVTVTEEVALTYDKAASFVLATGTDEQLATLQKTISAVLSVNELDAKARDYRALVG